MNEVLQPKRLFSYLFILAIAVVFTLQFGPGSRGCDAPLRPLRQASAAMVNGKEVSLRQFQTAYSQQLQMYRMQGTALPESIARQLGVPRQVLDQLVSTELLAQAAERQGVEPADEEIRDLIHKNPDFQKDGEFDYQRYVDVVREYYRKTYPEYEAELRHRLAASKMVKLIDSTAVVSEEEVNAKFHRDNNKAELTFVRFVPSQLAAKVSPPSAAELAAFQNSHEKEISDNYDSNRFLYQKPEQVRARHILIKLDQDVPKAKKDEARQKLEKIRQEAVGGKDFGELAKQYSEDTGSKGSGGDLGFNERQSWVPPFADAAFSLNPGEVSQPVETQFGLHLIKVEEKKPATRKELKDVQGEIARQIYTREKSKELAQAEAQKALAAMNRGKKLAELYPADKESKESKDAKGGKDKPKKPAPTASGDKITAVDTGPFSASAETIPQLGAASDLLTDVFTTNKPGPMGKVYQVGETYAVVEITSRTLPAEEEFASKKDTLRDEAVRAKQIELRDSYLKALKKSSNVVINEELVGRSNEPIL